MNRALAFVLKEFHHILRDRRSLIILFGMPLVQILLFGFAITNEIKDAKIAILDYSRDNSTRLMIDRLQASGYFYVVNYIDNKSQIEAAFRKGEIKLAVIFGNDFESRLLSSNGADIQIIADASDPNTASTLINYVSSIFNKFILEKNLKLTSPPIIKTEFRMRYNEELKGVFLFVPGLITIILMLVSAMMTSISITKEKEAGTMELMLVSPMKPWLMIFSKLIPYLLLSFLNAIIILILGKFVFHVPLLGSLSLLLMECILFIFCALSLGILISSITDSQQTALMLSLVGLMLPSILLSGFLFPIENMPLWLQYTSKVIPATWFLIIIKAIMLKGSGIEIIWKETLIIIGLTILFAIISIKKFKMRLE